MSIRGNRRERSLGATLLVWGIGLLGALFVLSIVVATVISIVTTVVAIVTTVATALLLAGIAYFVASWALGSGASGDSGDRHDTAGHRSTEYDVGAAAGRRPDDGRSGRERDESASLLERIPGVGGGGDGPAESAPEDPIDQLTDQYVSGEIGEAEYERRLERHLERSTSSRSRTGERTLDTEYER